MYFEIILPFVPNFLEVFRPKFRIHFVFQRACYMLRPSRMWIRNKRSFRKLPWVTKSSECNYGNVSFSYFSEGPTQSPIQWVPVALYLGVKRLGREADKSPPSSAELKNVWSYTSTPHTPSWRGTLLCTGAVLFYHWFTRFSRWKIESTPVL